MEGLMRRSTSAGQRTRVALLFGALVVLCASALAGAAPAAAAPRWDLDIQHMPTNLPPGENVDYLINATNRGDAPAGSDASTIEIDPLPAGLSATRLEGLQDPFTEEASPWTCDLASLTCVTTAPVAVGGRARPIRLEVAVDPSASGAVTVSASVSGGGSATAAHATEKAEITHEIPGFGIQRGSLKVDAFDRSGDPERQAGSHPQDSIVAFDFNSARVEGHHDPVGSVRDIEVTLPRGFLGNPQATPKCPAYLLALNAAPIVGTQCPVDTQVGIVDALITNFQSQVVTWRMPVYNIEPPDDAVAAFAFSAFNRPIRIIAALDPSDNSIVTTLTDINETFPIFGQELTLWGVPADPSHDSQRYKAFSFGANGFGWGFSSTARARPFLTLPSECGAAGIAKVRVRSWQKPSSEDYLESEPQFARGCEKQQFRASLQAQPDTTRSDTPTGMSVDLDAEYADEAAGLGTPPLKRAVVTLPDGLSVSPTSADGLGGCGLADIKLKTNDEPTCPDPSKIGTLSITTPLLTEPMRGSVFLAAQNDNPFRSLMAIYLVARAPGIIIKLAGEVQRDPSSGRLTAIFDDNPQLPFTNLHLEFRGGDRGTLATPLTCTTTSTVAVLTSWNPTVPVVDTGSPYRSDADGHGSGCPALGFEPSLRAGMTHSGAGKSGTFSLTFGRPDRTQYLSAIETSMPPGITGRIAASDQCSDAAANAGTCGESSRIGTASVAAGPGPMPFWTSGRVYLTGPYKGQPYGLSIVVPVIAGPFDLGTVVVRAAIEVDRETAALRVIADPMPSILEGIPLRVKTVNVAIDKPGFMINPTNCTPSNIGASISSVDGRSVRRDARFQVANCATLPLAPRMTVRIGRRGRTANRRTSPLTVRLSQAPGQANLRSVRVTLPDQVNARLAIVNRACTLEQFHAVSPVCEDARIGQATATTPLLREMLRGPVYFVRNRARRLPDIMVRLRGPVAIDLTGKVSISRGLRLTTTFDTIPDVPITTFEMRLVDGRKGPVGAAMNLCTRRGRSGRVEAGFIAQSNRRLDLRPKLQVVGCGRASARGRRGARARGRRGARARGRRGARARGRRGASPRR